MGLCIAVCLVPGFYEGVYADLLDEPLEWRRGRLVPDDRPGMGHNLNEDLGRDLRVSSDDQFQYGRVPQALGEWS